MNCVWCGQQVDRPCAEVTRSPLAACDLYWEKVNETMQQVGVCSPDESGDVYPVGASVFV